MWWIAGFIGLYIKFMKFVARILATTWGKIAFLVVVLAVAVASGFYLEVAIVSIAAILLAYAWGRGSAPAHGIMKVIDRIVVCLTIVLCIVAAVFMSAKRG